MNRVLTSAAIAVLAPVVGRDLEGLLHVVGSKERRSALPAMLERNMLP